MPKRFYNPEIFKEDWFIDLPDHYKLFWLFIKSSCDHGGFWRVNKNQYRNICRDKIPLLDDFLAAVNKEDGEPVSRIIVINKRTWFIPSHISEQCGHIFKLAIGAHRGILHTIVVNNINPSQVIDFDWQGIEIIEFQYLKKLVLGKSWHTLSELLSKSIVKGTVKGKGIVKGNKEEESAERNHEQPYLPTGDGLFKMQDMYDMDWKSFQDQFKPKKGLTEEGFLIWKKFVDWITQMEFNELFSCKFITPSDFHVLYQKGFYEDKWEAVCRKILGTGIKPEHNLYFRIPDFAEYLKKRNPKQISEVVISSKSNTNYTGSL